MLMLDIVAALRSRVPLLAQRVGGTASIEDLHEYGKLPVPAAYVIPMGETPGEQQDMNGYEQGVEVSFAVVVFLDNASDEAGQAAVTQLAAIQKQIFKALLGWDPPNYDAIEYSGGSLVDLDRSRFVYQFEFTSAYVLDYVDTWLKDRDDALPALSNIRINVDCIDPVDKNLKPIGPDGRIDAQLQITLPAA